MSFELLLVTVGLAGLTWLYAFTRQMARSQARFRSVDAKRTIPVNLLNNDGAVIVAEGRGHLIYISPRAAEWFELSGVEPNLTILASRVQPADVFHDLFAQEGRALLRIGMRRVEAASYALPTAEGQRFVVFMREVATSDKEEIFDTARALTVVQDISKTITIGADLNQTMTTILTSISSVIEYDAGEVILWDQTLNRPRPVGKVGNGYSNYVNSSNGNGSSADSDSGYTSWIARYQQPLLLNDVSVRADVGPRSEAFPYQSYVGVPLTVSGRFIGTIELASNKPHAFTHEDLRLLESVAGQAAVAIENSRLATEQANRILQLNGLQNIAQTMGEEVDKRELYQKLHERIANLLNVEICGLLLYDANTDALISQLPFFGVTDAVMSLHRLDVSSKSHAHRIWQSNVWWYSNQVLNDEMSNALNLRGLAETIGIHNAAMIPVSIGGKRIGMLLIANKRDDGNFTDDDMRLASIFATQAAIVVENANLYERERHYMAELANLQEIAQGVRRSPEDLIAHITEHIAQLLEVEMCGILLYENERKLLVAQSPFFGIDDETIKFYQIPIEPESIFVQLQEGKPYWYSNQIGLETWAGAVSFAQLANMAGVRKVMFAPLVVGDIQFGLLQIANPINERNFNQEDGRVLSLAATQAAVLLDNTNLHQDVERLSREALALRRIAERLAMPLNETEIFETVLDELFDVIGCEQVAIALLDNQNGKLVYRNEMMRGIKLPQSPFEIDIYSSDFNHSPIMSRKPFISYDIPNDKRVLPVYRELATLLQLQKDVLIVPLISNQRAIGELAVGNKKQGLFSQSDEELLLAIGAQIATALERARLYSLTDADLRTRIEEQEAIQRIHRELSETLLIDRVLEVIRNEALLTTNAIGVSVGLLLPSTLWVDEDVPELETRLGAELLFPNETNPAIIHRLNDIEKRMFDSAETIVVEDYSNADINAVPSTAQSALVEPIYFENEIIGFIHLYSDKPNTFDATTQAFVKKLGQQASLAVTNARRYRDQVQANERLKRRADQIQNVFRLGELVRQGKDIHAIMDVIAKNIRETVGFEQILIRVLNERDQTFDVVNHLGIDAKSFEDPSVRSRSIEEVNALFDPRWKTGSVYFFPANFQDEWRAGLQSTKLVDDPLKHTSGSGPRRWHPDDLLVIPVYNAAQKLIGIISLDDPKNGMRPTREVIDLLEGFAAQAAFAIESHQLVDNIRQQAEEARRERDRLAQLNLASSEIQRAPDMTSRLNAVAAAIHAAGWQHVQITLRDPQLEPTQFISVGYTPEEEIQIQRTLTPGSVWQERFNDLEFHELKLGNAYYLRYDSEWVTKNIRRGEPADPPQVDEDEWHPQDVIYLPLMGHDQKRIIGLIRLDSPVDGKRPTEQSLQPIELFALQAAAAIENQRLYTETVRQADIEQQLNRLMEAMASTLDQAEIILALSEGLRPFVIFTHMHLAVRSDADPDFFEMTRVELTPDNQTYILPDNPIPLQGTAAGEVYYTGETRIFELNAADAESYEYTDLQTWAAQGERNVLMVPLIAGGDRLGVLRLGSELDQAFRFADSQTLTLIQRMANLTTVSIQNSRLFNNLGESQSFNEAVVQSIQQGIVVLDENLRIRIANQYMMTHYGWTYQAVGSTLFEYLPELSNVLSHPIETVLETGRNTQKMDVTLTGQITNLEFLVNFYIYPLRQGTRVNGVVLLIEDITERAQLEADVRRRAEQLAALTNVSSSMTQTLQPDQVVEVVLDALEEVIPYDGVVLWLEHPTRPNSLEIVAARGFNDPAASSADDLIHLWIEIDDSLLFKEMAQQRQVVNIGDTADDPRFPMGAERVYRCFLAAPLISKGEIIGVLQVEKREPFFYDQNYEQLALAFANQAAVALSNARLFAETQQRAEELRKQAGRLALLNRVSNALSQSLDLENIFEITLRETVNALEVDYAAAIQINIDDGICRVIIEHPRGNIEPTMAFRLNSSKIMERIVEKAQPVLFNDIQAELPERQEDLKRLLPREDTLRTLFVPLVVSGKVIGVIRLDGGPESEPFTNEQVELAQTIASQASIAVQNASLYEQSLQRTYQLETLFEAGQATSGAIDVVDVLRRVATQMLIALRADSTEIMRWDQLENCLIVDQAKSSWLDETTTAEIRGLVYDLTTFPLRREVLQNRNTITLRIDDQDLDPSEKEHMEVHGVTNRILAPLVVNEVSIGLVQIDIRDENRFIDANQVRLVRTLANQAAVAIENARLQSETRSQIEELYLINELAKAVSSTVDVDELFETVKQQLPLLTDAQYLYVAIYDRETGKLSFPVALDDYGNTYDIEPFVPSEHDEFGYIIRTQAPLLLAGVGLQDVRKQFGITEPMFPEARSFLGVPMIAGDSFVGILALRDDLESRKFDFNDQRILSTVSSQIAVTLQNANLFARITDFANELNTRVEERTAELLQERQRLTTLYEIASEIAAATLDLDRVLNRTLEALSEAIGASSGIVLAIDDISDMLYVIAQRGLDVSDESERLQLRQNEGLAGWVIQHRQGVVINDVQNDPRWISVSERDRAPRSAIAALLESADDVRGVIMFFSERENAFNEDHLRLVTAASLQLANSMNNAELYSLIRDQAERLGAILRQEQVESTKTSAILNSVADGVMYANEKGIIRVFNNTASQILGLDSERVLNRHIRELAGVYGGRETGWMDAINKWMSDPTQHVESDFVEFTLTLDDGRVINVRLSPVNMGDQFLGTVSVFRDITREVEVDRLKSEFVATVSHELRTPMTSIKGYADLLLLGAAGALTEPQQRFLQTIKQNADRLSILVNDLLEVSRIDQGQMQLRFAPIDVEEVLQTLQSHLAGRIKDAERDIKIELHMDEEMPPLRGDFDRVIQILQNLVDNAFNYSQDPCTIGIRAEYNAQKQTILFAVTDEGIGIPPEIQDRIFERFFRGDEYSDLVMDTPGTGLGLAIVKELVSMHDGDIWFDTEVGKGTTFYVELPIYNDTES